MIAGLTYYQICACFLLYSFAGWCVEVAFHALDAGKVVNRGFLNGPVCPIYGFGMLAVFAGINLVHFPSVSGSPMAVLALFLGGMAVTTAIELFGGWILDRLFHARWWDYSNRPLNFHGYICLPFSVIWGLAVVGVVYLLHPAISRNPLPVHLHVPERIGWPILAVLYFIFAVDLGLTLAVLIGLNRKLKELDSLRTSMRRLSDSLSDTIAGTTIAVSGEAQLVEEKIAESAIAQNVKSSARTVKAGISTMSEKGKAGISAMSEKGKAGISTVSEMSKAGISAMSEKGKAGISAVSEMGKAGISVMSEKSRAGREAAQEKLLALHERYEQLIASIRKRSHFGIPRILRAFPEMVRHDYPDTFAQLRRRLTGGPGEENADEPQDDTAETENADRS